MNENDLPSDNPEPLDLQLDPVQWEVVTIGEERVLRLVTPPSDKGWTVLVPRGVVESWLFALLELSSQPPDSN